MRSVRKVLGKAVVNACQVAEDVTGKSINSLPEYFLAVKVAEYLNNHFSTFTFSMEEPLIDLCEEVGINHKNVGAEYRIDNNTRADLVLKNKKSSTIKHIVEFKRYLHVGQLRKDALRLAWICANAPVGHRIERNFLVVVSHREQKAFQKINNDIEEWVSEVSPILEVRYEPIDLSQFISTRPRGYGKKLSGGVWEVRCEY